MVIFKSKHLGLKICLTIWIFSAAHSQTNSRSYEANDWIPVYTNGNQNFPQLHAVHNANKQNKPIESSRQFPDSQQAQILQAHANLQLNEQRIHDTQVHLSAEHQDGVQNHVSQGLPFVHQHQQFLPQQVNYNEQNIQRHQVSKDSHSAANENVASQDQLNSDNEKEEVQLLYVPLQTLMQRAQRQQNIQLEQTASPSQVRFVDQQHLSPQQHKQVQLQNIQQDFIQQALQAHKLQQQFQQNYQQPLQQSYQQPLQQNYQQPQTTYKPLELDLTTKPATQAPVVKKRKPHQPPLAVYMDTAGHDEVAISDVLSLLKDAKTISVQDYVNEDSPKVFVGPSNLQSPDGYVKFDLPYLSSIDNYKAESKIDQLPFFVAPLNYKTPQGYSKIPFPSPHVGSVVINQMKEITNEKLKSSTQNLLTNQPLNDKNSQLLLNEGGTTASHNKNRQAYSPSSTIAPETPYGPLPVNQRQQTYSTPSPGISSTTRGYQDSENFSIHPNIYSNNQFQKGSRFSTQSPILESVSLPSASFTVTTNRNPSQTSQRQHRPQISISTPDAAYLEDSREKSSNRYSPENIQPKVQVTTSKQYLEAPTPLSSKDFLTQHRFADSNSKKKQETYVQNVPATLGFESHLTKPNFTVNDAPSDQEYKPQYQDINGPVQYETKPQRTQSKHKENSHVVTESSFYNQQVNNQHFRANEQYDVPNKGPMTPQVLESIRDNKQTHRLQSGQQYRPFAEPDINVYQQLPQQQDSRQKFSYNQPESTSRYEEPISVTTEKTRFHEYHGNNNEQHYKLPADLPISPQLPSLVNSLEDYDFRPLLAPLLLPSAEDTQDIYTEPEYTSTTVTTVPTTTTTEAVETTTEYKRLRSRPRGTRPTASPTRSRTSSQAHRGRRPYQGQHEVRKQEIIDTTTRASFPRNRFSSQRERQPVVSTTEHYNVDSTRDIGNRDNIQKRFRTRGRPVKVEEVYTTSPERSSSTETIVDIPHSTQFATQSLQNNVQVSLGSQETSTEQNERKPYTNSLQNDQPLAYLVNSQHIIDQNLHSEQETDPQSYVLNDAAPISIEVENPRTYSTVKEVVPPITERIRAQPQQEQTQYLIETTKPSRTRGRTRERSRTRSREEPIRRTTSAPTTVKYIKSKEQEEEEVPNQDEFYGFFRAPAFTKPVKMEYKPSSEMRAASEPVQQASFAPQYRDEPSIYVNSRSSTPSSYRSTSDEIQSRNSNQYVGGRLSSTPENVYEDIKPITIRTTPARRRYTTPNVHTQELSTHAPERHFTTRPKKRPETQTQRITRVRGRIRRPTTTSLPEIDSSIAESFSSRTIQTSSEPANYKQQSRGKTHFRPREQDRTTNENIDDNYPVSFLRSHEQTPRPSFQLTIEPEESVEEQEGAYSTNTRTTTKEFVKGEESQIHEKTVQNPNHLEPASSEKENKHTVTHNDSDITIAVEENTKPESSKLILAKNLSDSTSNSTTTEQVNITDITTVGKSEEETTNSPTTTTEVVEEMKDVPKHKKIRRGSWRLVKQRPVDMLQSAESQNIGTLLVNDLFTEGKPVVKYNTVQTTTEPSTTKTTDEDGSNYSHTSLYDLITFTTQEPLTTLVDDNSNAEVPTPSTIEGTTIAEEQQNDDQETSVNENEPDNENGQALSYFDQIMSNLEKYSEVSEGDPSEVVEDAEFWKSKIIGTSTTTEISHETEICYKGRCVKSLL